MKLSRSCLVAAVTVAAASLAVAPTARADGGSTPHVTTVNTSVIAPFQLSFSGGKLFVADGGTSKVSQVNGSSLTTLATGPSPSAGGDVAGLDVTGGGRLWAYTWTDHAKGTSALKILKGTTVVRTVDLSAYEKAHNPDGKQSYGIDNPSQCVKDAFAAMASQGAPPASYKGQVDSHPYSVLRWGDGWIVADAGGNDLLKVSENGRISTLAVLPPQPLKITTAIAASQHLPSCVAGNTYKFEPVPTDVISWGGWLWVTTLPGGPEDPSLGARGSVYKVNPWTGASTRVATGFAGATNLTVDDHGKIYVAELFGNRISTIRDGKPHTWVTLTGALSLEFAQGAVWAGTLAPTDSMGNPTGHGSIVKITN